MTWRPGILSVLRDASVPLTAHEIGRRLGEHDGRALRGDLLALVRDGLVVSFRGRASLRYAASESLVAQVPDAFSVVIWWEQNRDPELAQLLEHDLSAFLEIGPGQRGGR